MSVMRFISDEVGKHTGLFDEDSAEVASALTSRELALDVDEVVNELGHSGGP